MVQLIAPLDAWKTSDLPHLKGEMHLQSGEVRYIAYRPTAGEELSQEQLAACFATAEAQRQALTNDCHSAAISANRCNSTRIFSNFVITNHVNVQR